MWHGGGEAHLIYNYISNGSINKQIRSNQIFWFFSQDLVHSFRATSHTRLRARDHYTSSTVIGGKAEPVLVLCFTLCLRVQGSIWMQDGCKVHMDSYMASNGSCFMVTPIIFKNHLLEVDLIQNREIMALRNLTTVDVLYIIMRKDLHK